MMQIMATVDWRAEHGVEMRVWVDDHTEGTKNLFRYEESLRTEAGAEDPGCSMSALSALGAFLARAQHALDGVS